MPQKGSSMAVALKNPETPESAKLGGWRLGRLATSSLLGALFLLGGIGVVFHAVPAAWSGIAAEAVAGAVGSFAANALMILAMAAAAAGCVWLGKRLLGHDVPHGLRAGIFLDFAGLFLFVLVVCGIGNTLEAGASSEAGKMMSIFLTGLVGAGFLYLAVRAIAHPRYPGTLAQIEDQGWFSSAAYKQSQGQRVRRGTMLGILVLCGCGIYTLLSHQTLGSGVNNHWVVAIPFSSGISWRLLSDVNLTVPILLALGSLWLAYRVVNYPTFADFLIATEAEMNKVSWTTRKRLIQDTIVVLTTVILMTVFLFLVDVAWFWFLSQRWIGVLPSEPPAAVETTKYNW